ncbi:BREX system serine/threonine kinase PglW [Micromonospora sp. NPDC005206]|uniref:BREX system serine/threonine kinase PglW n=1 Tax=Micromonospora sp. NPDC005206 TaxID=3157022 RepID=UPI0033A1E48C
MAAIRDDSPRWREINASAWLHERAGLRHIKTLLPDGEPYNAWANVEFVGTDGSINEVDLLVLTPSGLQLVELKHWQGEISGNGTQWRVKSLNGRVRREDNPLILANRKAKRLASLLHHYGGQSGKDVKVPYVRAAIFLHAANMSARLDEVGKQRVYGLHTDQRSGLPTIYDLLTQPPTDQRDAVDRTRAREIVSLIDGCGIRPSIADRTVQGLLLQPKPFSEGPGWQDYLAGHKVETDIVRRVRFYLTSKASADDRDLIRRAAEREFRLLQGIYHPGIGHAIDLVDHEFGPAVIFEHVEDAVRLDHWLTEHGDQLALEHRLDLVRDLAEVLRYAHSRHLVHRALSPRAIFVYDPDKPRPRLVVTDWQAGGRVAATTTQATLLAGTTHVDQLTDESVRLYQAPELATNPDAPGRLLDMFSLGAITYLIFAGRPPATSPEALKATVAVQGGLELSAAADAVPETLSYLVYDATMGDTSKRTPSIAEFLTHLDAVEEELTAPEPAPVLDPLDAGPGDVLDGGLTVERRLGSGATSIALLVRREGNHVPLVLKVARDEEKRQRLHDEADQLRSLKHWQVAQLIEGPVTAGGRTGLLLEFAGQVTLAEELSTYGRLSLDLLERYGKDLLDILEYLDGQGVIHRDIKPANLAARPRPKDKQPHLCVFDFSLSGSPADQIGAGTPPYLDPFLAPPRRPRYDLAAERFAAAVTLFEMATGTLPRWGDGVANPVAIADEVSLPTELFDSAIADRLVSFFQRALARDARQRFDTTEEMADAWRSIFKDIPKAAATPTTHLAPGPAVTRDTPLDLVSLTERARSALERFGVRTVGELVDYDPMALSRLDGVPQATKTEIRRRAKELRTLFAPSPEPAPVETTAERSSVRGVDSLVEGLLPKRTSRNETEMRALEVMLGLRAPAGQIEPLRWPTQREVASALVLAQPQLSRVVQKGVQRWTASDDLAAVRAEMVELLDARGGVMSAAELAEALIASRGSFAIEPRRTTQAIGLVRAAVEVELSTGGDSRVGFRRFGQTVLVGREPDDPTATHTSLDLLLYAVALGKTAQKLVDADPLPTPSRAVERLRHTTPPAVMPALADARLVQLAAAAAGTVAVNSQLQLYPMDMLAERAIRLAAGSLVLTANQMLDVHSLHNRVRARFPQAAPLPERPALDDLLARCGIALEWDPVAKAYRPQSAPSHGILGSTTRWATSVGPLTFVGVDAVSDVEARIAGALERRAFLALLVAPPRLTQARRALLTRYPLTEVDVTRTLIETLRSIGVPWELVATSDAKDRSDPDRRSLEIAVRQEVLPRVAAAMEAAEGAVLLTEAGPLARYGCMDLLAQLADTAAPRPTARLLLAAARRNQPVLDHEPIPVTSSGQWLWLPDRWLDFSTEVKGQQ